MVEDGITPNDRRKHSPDTIERLRSIDPNLRVLRRTADGNVWVRSSLKTPQPVTDDEYGSAETSEAAMQNAWPSNQGANAIEAKTPDEDDLEAVVAEQPVGVAEGGERVGAEVGGLQAGGAGFGDAEGVLEVLVECVEEAV